MRLLPVSGLFALLVLSACATAPATPAAAPADPAAAGQPAPAPVAAAREGDKMRCTTEKRLGSHLQHRVCATEEQRQARMKQDREEMMKAQSRGTGTSGISGR